jgi:hypothetical protein
VRFKLNHGGSSLSFRAEFADGSRAAWKPMQTNMQSVPRKEVAAYRLNRLLGLHAVPPGRAARGDARGAVSTPAPGEPAVASAHQGRDRVRPRRPDHRHGVVLDPGHQGLRLRHARRPRQTQAWLTQGSRSAGDQCDGGAGVDADRVRLPDRNPDRYSGGNMKMSPDGKQLFFMDNTMSFYVDGDGYERNREVLFKTQRFSRALYQALDKVTCPTCSARWPRSWARPTRS